MEKNKLRRYICPVCGNYAFIELSEEEKALGEKPEDDFCNTCGWRFDERQFNDHDLRTEINENSVNECIEIYKQKLKINPKYDYMDEIATPDEPHKCPICGKYEFANIYSYDICPFCGWEDDGFEEEQNENDISATGFTYKDYKRKYEEKIKLNPNYKWIKDHK